MTKLRNNNDFLFVPSFTPELIKGVVGAGDAFCAGFLNKVY